MGPPYASHDPAPPADGKDRLTHHMPDAVFLQKQAVKSRTQIGCLESVSGIFFLEEPVSRDQGTAKACRHKIPVTRSMVIVPVAPHCNVCLFRTDTQSEGVFQACLPAPKSKRMRISLSPHRRTIRVLPSCFLFSGQIVHDSHYLDDPHLLKIYKIFIMFMK